LFGEEVFDLGVDAAEVVVGPAAQRFEEGWVEAKQKPLALGHVFALARCRAFRC
jgi:hypothetical protein